MLQRRTLMLVTLGAPLLAVPTVTLAQSTYPDKPITMIVPFPPGGVADTVARPVAEALSRELKQTVVVENRAGAGGAAGIGIAARAPRRRLHVLFSLSSISMLPQADKLLGRKPAYELSSSSRSPASPPTRRCWSSAPTRHGRRLTSSSPMRASPAPTTTAARATTARCTCRWRC